jgi:hypothetical protein
MTEQKIPQPDLYPAKGRYSPGEPIVLILEAPPGFADEAVIHLMQLETRLFEARTPVTGERTEIPLPEFNGISSVWVRAQLFSEVLCGPFCIPPPTYRRPGAWCDTAF